MKIQKVENKDDYFVVFNKEELKKVKKDFNVSFKINLPRKKKKALKKWLKENSYFIKGSDELFEESEMKVI